MPCPVPHSTDRPDTVRGREAAYSAVGSQRRVPPLVSKGDPIRDGSRWITKATSTGVWAEPRSKPALPHGGKMQALGLFRPHQKSGPGVAGWSEIVDQSGPEVTHTLQAVRVNDEQASPEELRLAQKVGS